MRRTALALTCAFFATTSATAATLRVAATDVPAALGNPYRSVGGTMASVWDLVFDCLIRFDEQGGLAAGLADRWENPTPTIWRFHLRPGATFTGGGPVDAAAVVATVELLKAHHDYAVAGEVAEIVAARALDADTVEIETAAADAILPRRFGLIRIVNPAAWAKLGPDGFARTPSGSGPYTVTSWGEGGSTIALTANPKSWRAPASVTRLEITILKDATTRVQALLSNQVDVALSLNPDDLAPLNAAGFATYVSKAGQVQVWALPNLLKEKSPLKDVRVRQAINYAVDKNAMTDALLQGIAQPASQGATPGTFGFDPELAPYPYDPAKARALLAEAGYANGFKLIADVVVGLGPADTQIHQKAAADLRAVGIDVELRTTPYSARPQKFYGGQWGDVDVFSTTWNGGLYRDVIRTAQDFACTKPNPFFCDDEITDLVAKSRSTMDPGEREQMLRNIMRLYRDRAAALYLTEYNSIIGLAPKVQNFRTRPTGMVVEDVVVK